MAIHLTSIARPYAQAAFEYAKEQQDLAAWDSFLKNAAAAVSDAKLYALINNEALDKAELQQVLSGVLGSSLNDARTNFLRLLVQNKRVISLPDIASEFTALVAAFMQKSNVRVVTAVDANELFKANLTKQLSQKLKREIVLHCEKDSSILGGAVIYIDNKVIDGSLRGKLNRLLEFTLR